MGRKSIRDTRRQEIIQAFARVLGNHGFAGATMQAVAEEAGLSPGLMHHYFSAKEEMLQELLSFLVEGFRARERSAGASGGLQSYVDAALRLGEGADQLAARCWVGLLAEALRDPALMARVKRHLEGEIAHLSGRSGGALSEHEASALLAYIFGCLVFGAFAPRKTAGFAAPQARRLFDLRETSGGRAAR